MTTLLRITAGGLLLPAAFLIQSCETGGAHLEDGSPLYTGEAMCADTSVDSPTDQACHEDCERPCGFNGLPHFPRGVKYCVCQGGVFIECRCPRAPWYIGAPDAPYCDGMTANGWADPLDDTPCENEWQQCVGRDPVDGFTPRGCVCLNKDGTDENPVLEWDCGSTEKWFYPDQSTE